MYTNNDFCAISAINEIKDIFFSYLEAQPNSPYNKIKTIIRKDRTERNGFSNFIFYVNELGNNNKFHQEQYNIKLFTKNSILQNNLQIPASRTQLYKEADFIIFYWNNQLLFSRKKDNKHSWIDNKAFRNITDLFGKKYFSYNIYNLLENHEIYQIVKDDIDKEKINIMNSFSLEKNIFQQKDIIKYNIDTSHIKQVQFDGKTPESIFYTFDGLGRYTNLLGTTFGLSLWLYDKVDDKKTLRSIYQKLRYAYNKVKETGKAYSIKIKLREEYVKRLQNDINSDFGEMKISENNEVTIFVGQNYTFDIIKNKPKKITENMKEYQKEYQKENSENLKLYNRVYIYLKRHNNQYKSTWTNEEIEIANKILKK